MKETILAVTANISIQKSNKQAEDSSNSNIRLCRVTKESISFKIEVDSNESKNILSRPLSDKVTISLKDDKSLEWTDRRGVYIISSDDSSIIDNLYKTIQLCKIQLNIPSTETAAWSPRNEKPDKERSNSLLGGYRGVPETSPKGKPTLVAPPQRPKPLSNSSNASTSRPGTNVPIAKRPPPPTTPPPKSNSSADTNAFKRIAPGGAGEDIQKRGSFLKRKTAQTTDTIENRNQSPRKRKKGSIKSEQLFLDGNQVTRSPKAKSRTKKTVQISSRWDCVVYVTQILISDTNSFTCSYDKKLVPKHILRTCKLLSTHLDKKYALCSVLEYDDLLQIKELETSGVKKSTDMCIASEFLIELLRSLSPVLVFDNFEPEKSFLQISGDSSKENEYLEKLIDSQPPENKALYSTVISLLKSAVSRESSHKVSKEDLAKLFGPFFIYPKDLSYHKTSPISLVNQLVL